MVEGRLPEIGGKGETEYMDGIWLITQQLTEVAGRCWRQGRLLGW